MDGEPNPAATFVFRYRDHGESASTSPHTVAEADGIDTLKSTLIIPRTPDPEPVEERDVDEMSRDELRAMQKRLKELEVANIAVY